MFANLKKTVLVLMAGLLLATAASAQTNGIEPGEKSTKLGGNLRTPYLKPNGEPAVKNLAKLFPGETDYSAFHVLAVLKGNKGPVPKAELRRAIANVFFTGRNDGPLKTFPELPDKFYDDLIYHLEHGEYVEKWYNGSKCHLVNNVLTGECNSDLTFRMASHDKRTPSPPTPVDFDFKGLVIKDSQIPEGVNENSWVKPVIVLTFRFPAHVNKEGLWVQEYEQPCLNPSGEDGSEPPPPPPPPPPTVVTEYINRDVPVTVFKAPETGERWSFKFVTDKDGRVMKKLPSNIESAEFVAEVGETSFLVRNMGITTCSYINPNKESVDAECMALLTPNVPVDATVTLKEKKTPKGMKDKTKGLVMPSQVNPPVEPVRYDYLNEKTGRHICGPIAVYCWGPPLAIGGIYLAMHRGHHDTPAAPEKQTPIVVPIKVGGPGPSPDTAPAPVVTTHATGFGMPGISIKF